MRGTILHWLWTCPRCLWNYFLRWKLLSLMFRCIKRFTWLPWFSQKTWVFVLHHTKGEVRAIVLPIRVALHIILNCSRGLSWQVLRRHRRSSEMLKFNSSLAVVRNIFIDLWRLTLVILRFFCQFFGCRRDWWNYLTRWFSDGSTWGFQHLK